MPAEATSTPAKYQAAQTRTYDWAKEKCPCARGQALFPRQ